MPQLSASRGFFFRGQLIHLLLLLVLLIGAYQLVDIHRLRETQLLGIGTHVWFAIALAVPIVHQVYVWLAWRGELCCGVVTRRLGANGLVIYQIVFFVLFLLRFVSLPLLSIADHDSFEMSIPARFAICLVLGVPAVYTLYSVVRYFGLARAAGIDHFDESYRNKPLVKAGIFRYTSNAMYSFAFLAFWAIAVAGASWAALVVAMFSHACIWVHYFCLERPDMKLIYGSTPQP